MIAVAVSGGVDSLYAVYERVREHGPEQVLALHARLLSVPPERDPVPGLHANCEKLGVPLLVVEAKKAFADAVIAPFAVSYAAGHTPNPCSLCNARIKFGLLLETALAEGADRFATGHYARLENHEVYGICLAAAADSAKDQSYFLALVPRDRLDRLCFPLADRCKADVRAELAEAGLQIPLPVESQEICFVPGDDYRAFLHGRGVELSGAGPVVLLGTSDTKVLGTHQGLWRYTEGQRRGLGIAYSEPLYVVGKDLATNTLLVGPVGELETATCTVENVNLLVPLALWPKDLLVRTRYRQRAVPATVQVQEQNATLYITFHTPQGRAAPGQLGVVYDTEGHVLAGGIISK